MRRRGKKRGLTCEAVAVQVASRHSQERWWLAAKKGEVVGGHGGGGNLLFKNAVKTFWKAGREKVEGKEEESETKERIRSTERGGAFLARDYGATARARRSMERDRMGGWARHGTGRI